MTKFRQPLWDEHNKFKEWHYWGFIDNSFIEPAWSPESSLEEAKEQSQQFTGLHDKNDKEIYEGDIVKIIRCDNNKEEIATVEWSPDDCSFCYSVGKERQYIYRTTENMKPEVIGNQTENPELLGAEK